MIFKYPYTDLYNLNLDWILQAIKEIQQITGELGTLVNSVNGMTGDVEITSAMITEIMGTIVTSLNGQSGDVTLTASDLLSILGGAVTSFNTRQGDVTLTASDINDTMIDITWTSDPGDILSDLTQADLDSMYEDGKRILIFLNNLSVPDQIYFLTLVGGEVTAQAYTPTASMAGVTTVNGYSGAVNLYADNIYLANDSEDTIEDALNDVDTALAGKQDTLTFDNTPTALSDNPVTSGGIASALSSLNTSLGGAINGVAANLGDLEGALAYVAVKTGNDWYAPSSPATIPEGSYIEIDHHIYTASTDITADAQLVVGSNITAVPDGALNQINGNLTKITGTGTINTSYISSGSVTWEKVGKIVNVQFIDLIFSASVTGNTEIITGLPKASNNIVFGLFGYTDNKAYRLKISANGTSAHGYYAGIPNSAQLYGTVSYVSD